MKYNGQLADSDRLHYTSPSASYHLQMFWLADSHQKITLTPYLTHCVSRRLHPWGSSCWRVCHRTMQCMCWLSWRWPLCAWGTTCVMKATRLTACGCCRYGRKGRKVGACMIKRNDCGQKAHPCHNMPAAHTVTERTSLLVCLRSPPRMQTVDRIVLLMGSLLPCYHW